MGKGRIDFEVIPDMHGGYTALSIYPPGTFIQNKGFGVFIGGSGVGERSTLEEAKSYLFDMALRECQRRINEGRAKMEFYEAQMARLIADGIGRKREDDVQGK